MKILETLTVLMVGLCIILFIRDEVHPVTCDEYSVVTSILTLERREGTIQLADGQVVRVNQAVIKPGDKYCTKWSRK